MIYNTLRTLSSRLSHDNAADVFSYNSTASPTVITGGLFKSLRSYSLSSRSRKGDIDDSSRLADGLLRQLVTYDVGFPTFSSRRGVTVHRTSRSGDDGMGFNRPVPLTVRPGPTHRLQESSVSQVLSRLNERRGHASTISHLVGSTFSRVVLSRSPSR